MDDLEKRKMSCHWWDINPCPFSPYRGHYTDYDMQAAIYQRKRLFKSLVGVRPDMYFNIFSLVAH
jgi:hypothetical protein